MTGVTDRREPYDVIVIGGGPAGIFAAYTLARAGRSTLLLEAGGPMVDSLCPKVKVDLGGRLVHGSERLRMQCPRCTCLTGLGGAAFHFDTNLGYPSALSRSKVEQAATGEVRTFSSLERALGTFERAEQGVRDAFAVFHEHGLARAEPTEPVEPVEPVEHRTAPSMQAHDEFAPFARAAFVGADLTVSQSITVGEALSVIDSMMATYRVVGGEVRFHTRARSIEKVECNRPGDPRRFVVVMDGPNGTDGTAGRAGTNGTRSAAAAESVVVAVGKLGLGWVRSVIDSLGLASRRSAKVDLGVRIEAPREQLAPLSSQCANPKLAYLNPRGESVRTFCVCAGGRIMQYAFDGAMVLDGQHCLTSPTTRSNFGIVTTVKLAPGADGTDHALSFAREVTRAGHGRPVACTVGELRRGPASVAPPTTAALDTSLIEFEHASLRACLPPALVEDVLAMVDRLDAVFPGMIDDDAVVAAPVIERIYPELVLSDAMQSSEPGLYFVGDASSKIIGVTYGASTGLAAARDILHAGRPVTTSLS